MASEKFKVKYGLAVGDTAATIDATTGDIETIGDITVGGNEIKSNGGTVAITLNGADITTGDITLSGGDIRSASGTVAIAVSGADMTTGDITLNGGDIRSAGGTVAVSVSGSNATVAGDLAVNGGDITTTQTTANILNATATTVNIAGAATTVNIGADVGTTTVNNALAADSITTTGDAAINGGDITTSATTATVFNATATTLNMGGAATTVSIGANTGTTTINNSLVADDISILTVDTTNLEVTNIKAKDGTAAMTIVDATGAVNVSTSLTVDNIDIRDNTISSTNVNGDILIQPNGTGDVDLIADTVQVGDSNSAATITTNGTGDLILNTNNGTNAGNITLTNGVNGSITATMNGTGNFAVTANNGGNLTNTRNYVFGAIRDATTQANGDMWSFASGTAGSFRGVSIDNSANTAKRPGYVVRSFSGGATGPRTDFIYEVSRGTAASPTAVQLGDFIGEVHATGRTSTGWLSDLVTGTPSGNTYYATENWVGITNCGAGWGIQLQPTNTTLTAGGSSRTTVYDTNPQYMYMRNDAMVFSSGKTFGFVATGCSVSGTTLTIGTITSGTVTVGRSVQTALQGLAGAYIVANISGSGNGSTWQLSQSQNTLSGVTIFGSIGFMGTADGGTTMDMLRTLRIMDGTMRSATSSYAFDTNTGTDLMTIAANGTVRMLDPTVPAQRLEYISGVASGSDDNNTLTIQQNSATANDNPVFNFYNRRTTDNVNFTPTQNNDILGGFKFNGQSATSTTPAIGMPTQVRAIATENWTGSAQGTKIDFTVNKKGATTGVTSISSASDVTTFRSDSYSFRDSASTAITGNNINYNRVYGQWEQDGPINPVAANTSYVFPIGTAVDTNIATVVSTSQITPGAAGKYNLQFSLQWANADNTEHTFYVWLRKNGVNVANSTGDVTCLKSAKGISGWNYIVSSANATDYWELAYQVTDTDVTFPYVAAQGTAPNDIPACPALITTLTPVGA